MTPLHQIGDFFRDLFGSIPLPVVRGIFIAVPAVLLVWVLLLPRRMTTPPGGQTFGEGAFRASRGPGGQVRDRPTPTGPLGNTGIATHPGSPPLPAALPTDLPSDGLPARPHRWDTDLKVWAALALVIQIVIYAVF